MRISLIEFNPSGGLFQYALQMGDALAGLGHDVELVTGHDPEAQPVHPRMRVSPVLPTWHPAPAGTEPALYRKARRVARAGRYGTAWLRLVAHLRRTKPDVVQWASWRFALDGAGVLMLRRALPRTVMADVVHSPRAYVEQRTRGGLYKSGALHARALRASYAAMDVLFVLGDRSAEDFDRTWGNGYRVETIPHGDEGLFARDAEITPAEDTPPSVLFFGTLTRYKGLDLLLDAFTAVQAQRPDARLVVAGAPSADFDHGALAQRASRVGGVDVRAGYVPMADVPGLVSAARVVVLPYVAAYQSGVLHLAHTLARPVVATDVGDLASATGDGGIVVAPADVAALTEALLRLLENPDLAGELGRNGQQAVTTEASWPAIADRVASTYAELVAVKH